MLFRFILVKTTRNHISSFPQEVGKDLDKVHIMIGYLGMIICR